MLLSKTKNCTESKVWNSPPKKARWENRRAQKSVEKMQARGKTCFWCNTRNTLTHSELRKGALKTQPQMKHTKDNRCPEMQICTTWCDTQRMHTHQNRMEAHTHALACWLTPLDQWGTQMPHLKPAKCNHAWKVTTRTMKYAKRWTKLHTKAVGMTHDKGRKPEDVVSP